jgi:hypothetical protein
MRWRGKMYYIGWWFSREKSSHTTPVDAIIQFDRASKSDVIPNLIKKSYLFPTMLDEDDFYMEIELNEIYNFLVLSFYI